MKTFSQLEFWCQFVKTLGKSSFQKYNSWSSTLTNFLTIPSLSGHKNICWCSYLHFWKLELFQTELAIIRGCLAHDMTDSKSQGNQHWLALVQPRKTLVLFQFPGPTLISVKNWQIFERVLRISAVISGDFYYGSGTLLNVLFANFDPSYSRYFKTFQIS